MSSSVPINQIPQTVLERFDANQVVLVNDRELGDRVQGTITLDPRALHDQADLEALAEIRKAQGVHSITLTVVKLTPSAIDRATEFFDDRFRIVAELDSLVRHFGEVNVAYVVTHFNADPLRDLTIFIGGDCYRTGPEIKDLAAVLGRTRDLARAMLSKAVTIFPDIPALHGGKKGEWIVLDRDGQKIDGLSEEAIVALGTLVVPRGIRFLNEYKEGKAVEAGVLPGRFPDRGYIRPDTASPDVLSGPNWKAMCGVWQRRGVDLSHVTCLPDDLDGPLVPSSYPTAHGVVASATRLLEHLTPGAPLGQKRFLLEALGGVGQTTVEGLLERGATPERIVAFDPNAEICKKVQDKFGVTTRAMTHDEFYSRLDAHTRYDVWINNGEGDNTTPAHVDKLLESGIQVFCGAANNLFQVAREGECLERIFQAGAWAWPDTATSGGGWTLAVIDLLTRAQGRSSNTPETRERILRTIRSRNESLIDEALAAAKERGRGALSGEALWKAVDEITKQRLEETLARRYSPSELFQQADTTLWNLEGQASPASDGPRGYDPDVR